MYWEGNMVEKNHRTKIFLSKIKENEEISASVKVSVIESRSIDCVLETSDYKE